MQAFAYPFAVSAEPQSDEDVQFNVTWHNGVLYVRYVRPAYARAFRAYLNAAGKAGAVRKYKCGPLVLARAAA